MASLRFEQTIFVRAKHFIQEICGLDDAFDFLDEWPDNERDVIYQTAVRACRDASIGRLPLYAAEETFRRFAKKKGIWEEIENVPLFLSARKDRSVSGA